MEYDFDKPVDRRGTNSLKWEVGDNELPLWVADMDFQTAPEIINALRRRVDHGVFGYSVVPDAWYKAYIDWWKENYSLEIEKDRLIFCTGVVPAISSCVRKLTEPGDRVLIQSPVYNIFYNSILNNRCEVLESPLVYNEGKYSIDFKDLEEKLKDPRTTMMILCNPHNPVGKIWDRETLAEIGYLCRKNNVTVFSDEIHSPLTDPGKTYIPFASVSEDCALNSVTAISPSKAFNLAGLHSAAVYVPNEDLFKKVNRGLNTDEVAEPNAFAVQAAIAALTEGEEWLNALRTYLYWNKFYTRQFIEEYIPSIRVVDSEATYLLWIDCRGIIEEKESSIKENTLQSFLREKTGLYLSEGSSYGPGGEGFLRMNAATSLSVVKEALSLLEKGIRLYRETPLS